MARLSLSLTLCLLFQHTLVTLWIMFTVKGSVIVIECFSLLKATSLADKLISLLQDLSLKSVQNK